MVLDIFLAVRAPPSPPLVLQILILFLPVEKILMLKLPEIRVLIVLLDDSQHYFVFCFCSEIGMKKNTPSLVAQKYSDLIFCHQTTLYLTRTNGVGKNIL